jgi:hypothetical protein
MSDLAKTLKPAFFTPEHEEVYNLLGEELCEKFFAIVGSTQFNVAPIITYIKNRRTAELINNGELTFAQIAMREKIAIKSVYNLNKMIKERPREIA